MIKIFTLLLIFQTVCYGSITVGNSEEAPDSSRALMPVEKEASTKTRSIRQELEGPTKWNNFPQGGSDKKKHRSFRKKKEKDVKKMKTEIPFDYVDSQMMRNHEKVNLVRNKTIEILKKGMRILSESYTQNDNKTLTLMKETLLQKILSSAVSKPEMLSSATRHDAVPIGLRTYEIKSKRNSSEIFATLRESDEIHKGNEELETILKENFDIRSTPNNNFNKASMAVDYQFAKVDKNVGTMLEQIVKFFQNLTSSGTRWSPKEKFSQDDPCQKWIDCKENLDKAFQEENANLPSCPCMYPSSIFYDDAIWDEKQKKYFRWRDASSGFERLDIYKPSAAYCIRSLLTRGSVTVSSQQCCYDRKLQLITRGSGAGTINFVSPDVSKRLHYTIDILPWRLCKGDFTRYNTGRSPNNGNECPANPNEQQYQLQLQLAKIF